MPRSMLIATLQQAPAEQDSPADASAAGRTTGLVNGSNDEHSPKVSVADLAIGWHEWQQQVRHSTAAAAGATLPLAAADRVSLAAPGPLAPSELAAVSNQLQRLSLAGVQAAAVARAKASSIGQPLGSGTGSLEATTGGAMGQGAHQSQLQGLKRLAETPRRKRW